MTTCNRLQIIRPYKQLSYFFLYFFLPAYIFSQPNLSNGRAYTIVVVRLSVVVCCTSVMDVRGSFNKFQD